MESLFNLLQALFSNSMKFAQFHMNTQYSNQCCPGNKSMYKMKKLSYFLYTEVNERMTSWSLSFQMKYPFNSLLDEKLFMLVDSHYNVWIVQTHSKWNASYSVWKQQKIVFRLKIIFIRFPLKTNTEVMLPNEA